MDGRFTVAQVERLTGVNPKTLHYWDRTGFVSPSLGPSHGTGSRRIYSFRDLVILRVAAQLRDVGPGLHILRPVVTILRDWSVPTPSVRGDYLITNGHQVRIIPAAELMAVVRDWGPWVCVIDLSRVVEQLRADMLASGLYPPVQGKLVLRLVQVS